MNKIQNETALILTRNVDIYSSESRKQLAEDIHKTYLSWLRFWLPDLESGWTLKQCLDELERIFKEE